MGAKKKNICVVMWWPAWYNRPMQFDPHMLNQIIQRISQQMRCPQCGEKIPVDFASVRLTGDDFLLLQLKCEVCDAFIVLHAALQGAQIQAEKPGANKGMNASSSLCLKDDEVETLRAALNAAGGSFEKLFEMAKEKQKD